MGSGLVLATNTTHATPRGQTCRKVVCGCLRGETESEMLVGPLQKATVPVVHINCFG